MEDLFAWLLKLDPKWSVLCLGLIALITILLKSKTIITVFEYIWEKRASRSCGDCILILFGIREKYEAEIESVDKNVLRAQMVYFEQKESEIVQKYSASYRDDIETFGKDVAQSLKIAQINNYQEALKNSLKVVKEEIRRSFKENGFNDYGDKDYSSYVKEKAKSVISIVHSYLATYCYNSDPIVPLGHRFEKLDVSEVESVAFDVYNNARMVYKDHNEKVKTLKEDFKKEIDAFTKKP